VNSMPDLERQRAQLLATIGWAQQIQAILQPLLDAHGDRVHFRPFSGGVAMVSVLHDRPQRGKSGIKDLRNLADHFEDLFQRHCVEIEQGRETGEKELQSFLIRESYRHGRAMLPLIEAGREHGEELDLVFVTDEQLLPLGEGKLVCDLLALRRDPERGHVPVLLELKDARQMTRLIEQVESFARLIDLHADLFAQLYTALLGFEVRFSGPTEKWIVWPALGADADPREPELQARGIRVVGYRRDGDSFRFRLGPACEGRRSCTTNGPHEEE
jgi:hypothetical protein